MKGAQFLVKALEHEGVEVIFGYPGGAIMPVYDALIDSRIRHVLVRHEQAAALAADGYSRASGKVGVCMATSGPGRDESRDRHCERVHGFDSDGGDHRPSADGV